MVAVIAVAGVAGALCLSVSVFLRLRLWLLLRQRTRIYFGLIGIPGYLERKVDSLPRDDDLSRRARVVQRTTAIALVLMTLAIVLAQIQVIRRSDNTATDESQDQRIR